MQKLPFFLVSALLIFSLILSGCKLASEPEADEDLVPPGEVGTAIVKVSVTDNTNGDPVNFAIVRLLGGITEVAKETDSDGNFSSTVTIEQNKDIKVIVVKSGYYPDTTTVFVISGSTNEVNFNLQQKTTGSSLSGPPASIFLLSQSTNRIGVKESGSIESANFTFVVQDSTGNPIDIDHSVEVNIRFGFSPGGGEFIAPNPVKTNAEGKIEITLSAGMVAGAVQFVAEIFTDKGTITSKPVSATIHGGLPDFTHFSIGSDRLNYPYYSILNGTPHPIATALVGDKYSNPVRVGTAVYFSSTAGVIEGSATANTDNYGLAAVEIVSGNPQPNDPVYGPGFFFVTASTVDENENSISTKTRILFSAAPTMSISPGTIDIANGGAQSFTYIIQDFNGNPLASQNTYSVSVKSAGNVELTGDVNIKMPDTQFGFTNFSFSVYDTKPDSLNIQQISVTVETTGENGNLSQTISGITR